MSERRGCFKVGCLGCLGVTAVTLFVLVVLVLLGLLTGGREQRIEPLERSHVLPSIEPSPLPRGDFVAPFDDDEAGPTLVDREIEVAEPGRIVLDLNRGEFEIRPGPPGQPIRLEGRYDAGRYELEEHYESYGENGWIYRVEFDQRGFGLRPFVHDEGRGNRIRLIVPRDAPIVLEGRIGIGVSELELGGLWVLGVDLDLGVGEHGLSFNEPLPVPMGKLRLDTSVGVIEVDGLGNASPREVWVKHSVGETRIDLRGAWRRDAEVYITCGIGECDVRVPEDVRIEMRRVGVTIGDSSGPRRHGPLAPDAPTLELSVSGSIGEVRVH